MNVLCIETDRVYCSSVHAGEKTGMSYSSIVKVCNGLRKQTNGMHFEWTAKPITETRTCRCGTEFLPVLDNQTYCSEQCKMLRNKWVEPGRPFSDDTNRMIVADAERGKGFSRLAEATFRTVESITEQYVYLMQSGEYERLRRRMGSELPSKMSFIKIA
jgi:hypothetical protein